MWSPVPTPADLLEPRSRTHYQLLGISTNERDPGVIEEAAVRLSGHVRAYQLTRAPECSRLLDAIAQALMTLLDPVQRAKYDQVLHNPPLPAVPSARRARRSTPSPLGLVLVPLTGDCKAARPCDVELVFRDPSV
jgi:hypothetical protein